MLAFVIALFLLTNATTFFVVRRHYSKISKKAENTLQSNEEKMKATMLESQKIKQALADITYKNRELEKDLASARRQ